MYTTTVDKLKKLLQDSPAKALLIAHGYELITCPEKIYDAWYMALPVHTEQDAHTLILPIKSIRARIKEFTGEVTLVREGDKIKVSDGITTHLFNAVYPATLDRRLDQYHSIVRQLRNADRGTVVHREALLPATKALLTHINKDDERAGLRAAHVQITSETSLQVTATDGHRLHTRTVPCRSTKPLDYPVTQTLIPFQMLQVLRRMVAGAGQYDIHIASDSKHTSIVRDSDGTRLVFYSHPYPYPNYAKVIPTLAERPRRMTLDRKIALSVLADINKDLWDTQYPWIKLRVDGSTPRQATLSVQTGDKPGQSTLPVIDMNATPLEQYHVSVSARYLSDALKHLSSETVTLAFHATLSEHNSILLTGLSTEQAVVMPISA